MAVTVRDMMKMSQIELDELFKQGSVGEIPMGNSQGTAIFAPGSAIAPVLSSLTRLIVWQGKVFDRDHRSLLNKILPFHLRLVKAQIYQENSWFDGKEAIILDYSKTSFIAQKVRDEIREVSPGIYLGQAFWGTKRVLNFVLEF